MKTSLAVAAGAVLPLGPMIPRAHALSLQSGSVLNQGVSLNDFTSGSNILVQYNGLYNNQPDTYGNVLALWEDVSQVPYGQTPLSQTAIAGNAPAGSQFMSAPQASQTPYLVGYATSSDPTTVCSTLSFFPGRFNGVSFMTQLHMASLGATSTALHFQTPPGNQPATKCNWIGLWKGSSVNYDGCGMLAKTMIVSDSNSGTVAINNIPIMIGATYTAAYFIGEKNTDIAATTTFSV